ncbi:hypothetical protein OPV22_026767 [Ensete ventricosum]|uniref:Uncharacterized protein n=1 Tax=Ensete ventricosum TaxID=4639 RepID=A0AAV8PXZ3_ENSVE|nr:hypothetical protein OPV22_026767 [Ensete ventricosum]
MSQEYGRRTTLVRSSEAVRSPSDPEEGDDEDTKSIQPDSDSGSYPAEAGRFLTTGFKYGSGLKCFLRNGSGSICLCPKSLESASVDGVGIPRRLEVAGDCSIHKCHHPSAVCSGVLN